MNLFSFWFLGFSNYPQMNMHYDGFKILMAKYYHWNRAHCIWSAPWSQINRLLNRSLPVKVRWPQAVGVAGCWVSWQWGLGIHTTGPSSRLPVSSFQNVQTSSNLYYNGEIPGFLLSFFYCTTKSNSFLASHFLLGFPPSSPQSRYYFSASARPVG